MTSNKSKRWLVSSIFLVLFGFICFMLFLWKIGLFNFGGTDASAKIVASSLALVGALFGSIITLIGIFLKHSLDLRTIDLKNQEERRLQLEFERNNSQREEAEKRLKLEAAIQAVQLLSSSSGTNVPMTQRAGVLFTLSNLGLMDLSISILKQMVLSDQIDAGTASEIINYALESNDHDIQQSASRVLYNWPEKFLIEGGGMAFPACVSLKWNMKLSKLARRNTLLALLRIIVSRDLQKWNRGMLNSMVATLCSVWENDNDDELRNGVGICLKSLLKTLGGSTLILPDGYLNIDTLSGDVVTADPQRTSTDFHRLNDRIKIWLES